jgi:hypothetical protein
MRSAGIYTLNRRERKRERESAFESVSFAPSKIPTASRIDLQCCTSALLSIRATRNIVDMSPRKINDLGARAHQIRISLKNAKGREHYRALRRFLSATVSKDQRQRITAFQCVRCARPENLRIRSATPLRL